MPTWTLTCLICVSRETDLLTLQEHAMHEHDVTRDDLIQARRRGPIRGLAAETYEWTLPDGRTWLRAEREAKEEIPPARKLQVHDP